MFYMESLIGDTDLLTVNYFARSEFSLLTLSHCAKKMKKVLVLHGQCSKVKILRRFKKILRGQASACPCVLEALRWQMVSFSSVWNLDISIFLASCVNYTGYAPLITDPPPTSFNILSKFQLSSCYGLGVMMFWRLEEKDYWINVNESMNELMSDKGDCRTSPATPRVCYYVDWPRLCLLHLSHISLPFPSYSHRRHGVQTVECKQCNTGEL